MKIILATIALAALTTCADATEVTKQAAGIPTWQRQFMQSKDLVIAAANKRDLQTLKREGLEIDRRLAEVQAWPQDEAWTLARVSCAMMAQEFSNYVADKVKETPRGETSAQASIKAAKGYGRDCDRGLKRLR